MKRDGISRALRSFPVQIYLLGLGVGAPWMVLHLIETWVAPIGRNNLSLVYLLIVTLNVILCVTLWRHCTHPFFTLANLLRSIQLEDYTRRAVPVSRDDALGLLYEEINTLADLMQENRISTREQTPRFQSLIDHLEVAILAFDEKGRLMMANRQACRHFDAQLRDLVGRDATDLRLEEVLSEASGTTLSLSFLSRTSRYLLNRSDFREHGRPCRLVVLTDLSSPLREEERSAWKRLIRVLGHELNNSLTPILSITDSLSRRLGQSALPEQERKSYQEGLQVVGNRAENLRRFVQDYSELAKLPAPTPQSIAVADLAERTAALVPSVRLMVNGGPRCRLIVDPAQIEQALINLVRNALEATAGGQGRVFINWSRETTRLLLNVDDEGPGISEQGNLFVPFYSTKPGGSGIGLVLSRQIAEANGGTLTLANRPEGGCRAQMILPLDLR